MCKNDDFELTKNPTVGHVDVFKGSTQKVKMMDFVPNRFSFDINMDHSITYLGGNQTMQMYGKIEGFHQKKVHCLGCFFF